MEKTPRGTSVGVDDPYAFAGVCDHCTDDGRCRYAFERPDADPSFARERAAEKYACPVHDPDREETPADCPHFRSRNRDRECVRCGLEERRLAHDDERPLLEEHHLSYADETDSASEDGDADAGTDELSHEITVYLCRWCHSKVHSSWARIDDDASPDPEAIAELEGRRSRERAELGFESAATRYGDDG
ncbi:DUF7097 family protein [Natronococcus occultus]|uniref:Uncharacterized protein n=1 Tax=Natronococcus occultus SP4 TaxID=694430 RepID=L0JY43_9EURY|nr:hypothetical protein [Natronococcus occultus]AGB37220.1 hypothetical protein Natoc_1408 [Natronococcus occultus SP4]